MEIFFRPLLWKLWAFNHSRLFKSVSLFNLGSPLLTWDSENNAWDTFIRGVCLRPQILYKTYILKNLNLCYFNYFGQKKFKCFFCNTIFQKTFHFGTVLNEKKGFRVLFTMPSMNRNLNFCLFLSTCFQHLKERLLLNYIVYVGI